jgi:hypothetical protein
VDIVSLDQSVQCATNVIEIVQEYREYLENAKIICKEDGIDWVLQDFDAILQAKENNESMGEESFFDDSLVASTKYCGGNCKIWLCRFKRILKEQ